MLQQIHIFLFVFDKFVVFKGRTWFHKIMIQLIRQDSNCDSCTLIGIYLTT